MAQPLIEWTEEHAGVVRRMWTSGATATAIAQELGVTKNAILGRIRRMGLTRNPKKPYVAPSNGPMAKHAIAHPLWDLPEGERRLVLRARAAAGASRTLRELRS